MEIMLPSGTKLTVTMEVDIFTLSLDEREFVLGLVDHIKKQLTEHQVSQQEQDAPE